MLHLEKHANMRSAPAKHSFLTISKIIFAAFILSISSSSIVAHGQVTTATPVFSPASGTYHWAQSVSISDATANAIIYYTLDGSVPSTSSPVYTGPFTVVSNTTVQSIALAAGDSTSSIATVKYAFPASTVGFRPAAGAYTSGQSVSITSYTPNSTIYYTTDGSIPTMASNLYTGPVSIGANLTLTAIATAANYNNSWPAAAVYVIAPPAAVPTAAPIVSLPAGTYSTVQTVSIGCSSSGAVIYYTTNGTSPNTSSAVYSGPLTVSSSQTLSAMALASRGSASPVVSAAYTIVLPAAAPAFSLAAGKYSGVQTLTITDATAGAAIYLTTNGSTPTTASALYTGPISIAASQAVQTVAITAGGSLSPVAQAIYTINGTTAVAIISPVAGTYFGMQTISIADVTPNTAIYYTVNGRTPNSSSTLYSGPFAISSNSTVQAVAQASGDASSSPVSSVYIFPAATPAISPAPGTFLAVQSVTITSSTPGASIYYTISGALPTTGSIKYTGPISVSANETIEAISALTGMNNSSAASSAYVITLPAPAPAFSPAAGTYLRAETVSINSSSKSTVIYYTIDGSTPTTASPVYTGPLTVASNETISAIALAPGGSNSPAASAVYTITLPASAPAFSPAAGKYTTIQSVTLSDSTSNAAIYYTTDGSTPSASSNLYTAPISVAASETLNAVAIASGGSLGPIAKAGYTITLPTAVPVMSPASGTYNLIQSVTITDATPGAVIYYTVNGRFPTTASPVYTGPITAATNTLIQAIAAAPTDSISAAATTQYTIVAPSPIIIPGSGTFNYTTSVVMASVIPGATIYYTSNGATPTASSAIYTGPITVSPQQTTTEVYQAIEIAPGYLLSGLSSSSFTVTLAAGVLAQATVNPIPQKTIPANFLGLSEDYRQPTGIMGQASTGVNQGLRNLVGNLTQYLTAPLLFRIVGDNTTAAQLQPDIEPLVEFAQAVNVNYTLGVDLMNDNVATAEEEATQWVNGIPNNLIQAIEIGNEPDGYVGEGARTSPYTYPEYSAQFQQWQQGIQASVGDQFGVMGPSGAGSAFNAGSESDMAAGIILPVIVSQHAYLAPAATGQTLPPDYLLEPSAVTKLPLGYQAYAADAHQAGLLFRIGEMNSIWGGGTPGISNSFQSALWSIDVMFNFLNDGADGVNWHSGQYTSYALYEFKPQPQNGMIIYELTTVNPLYYGLLTFAQIAGRGAQLLPVATMTDSNVSIWATVDNTSTAHVVVINKDELATGNIQINLPGYTTGTVRYLQAPSYTSINGVTLGGQTFDGSTDGTIQGQLVTTTITAQDGTFTLPNMPVTTAAIIDFTN
jgi:Chitobiase/beta-hexosaminidase C-terminal domain/Fn3 associated/Glycosyl hydrolase family 79 C-terminal beta domain